MCGRTAAYAPFNALAIGFKLARSAAATQYHNPAPGQIGLWSAGFAMLITGVFTLVDISASATKVLASTIAPVKLWR